MATLKDVMDLQERVDTLKEQVAKAKGARDQTLKRLREEFGCTTLAQAEQRLKTLQQDEVKAKAAYDKAHATFMAEHGAALGLKEST